MSSNPSQAIAFFGDLGRSFNAFEPQFTHLYNGIITLALEVAVRLNAGGAGSWKMLPRHSWVDIGL